MFDIGHAECTPVDDLAVFDHLYRRAGCVGSIPFRKQGIGLLLLVSDRCRCMSLQTDCQEQRRYQNKLMCFHRAACPCVDASISPPISIKKPERRVSALDQTRTSYPSDCRRIPFAHSLGRHHPLASRLTATQSVNRQFTEHFPVVGTEPCEVQKSIGERDFRH